MRPAATALVLLLAAASVAAGCSTKRFLTIRSEPPGAHVWVNGEDRGTTPVEVPFVHYGRFEIRMEKAGYDSIAGEVNVPTQIDGYPVVDLPSELTVRERRFEWTGHLRAIPAHPTKADALAALERGRRMREATHRAVGEGGAAAPGARGAPCAEDEAPPRVPSRRAP